MNRLGTTPGGSQVVSAQANATGARALAALGNASANLSARVHGLVPGATYYWSVQAVDAGYRGSAFAPEGSFTLRDRRRRRRRRGGAAAAREP